MMNFSGTNRCLWGSLLVFGAALFVLSASTYLIFPHVLQKKVSSQLPLAQGAPTVEKWSRTAAPIFLKVYIFNITNLEEVEDGKPFVMEEVGPFVFSEKRHKAISTFTEHNRSIIYNDLKTFYFNEEMTAPELNLNMKFNVLNLPLITFQTMVSEKLFKTPTTKRMLSNILNSAFGRSSEKVVISRTADQILFKGAKVEWLAEMYKALDNIGIALPYLLPNNTFGIFYGKNGTNPISMEINTGVEDITRLGRLERFDGQSVLPFWKSKEANQLKGTDGSHFHPQVKKDEKLDIFNIDLCRSLYLQYERDQQVRGIDTFKFKVPTSLFIAPANNPAHAGFCTKEQMSHPLCKTDGILDVSTCKKGSPIVISSPHFYGGDLNLLSESVKGMEPDALKHETFLNIEPMTGLVFRAARRMQVNAFIQRIPSFESRFSPKHEGVIPYLWIEESAKLTEEMSNMFKDKIVKSKKILDALTLSGMCIGLLFFLLSLIMLKSVKKGKESFSTKNVEMKSASYSSLPTKDPTTK